MYCGHTCVSVTLEPKSLETIVLILCIQFSIPNFEPVPYNICELCASSTVCILDAVQKPNSWTYNFVDVSMHNLESSQTCVFRIQCLDYKPVSNHFCWGEMQGGKLLSELRQRIRPLEVFDSRHSPSCILSLISSPHFVLNMYKIRNYVACHPFRSTLVRIYDPALWPFTSQNIYLKTFQLCLSHQKKNRNILTECRVVLYIHWVCKKERLYFIRHLLLFSHEMAHNPI
jgi:hypothetical protein